MSYFRQPHKPKKKQNTIDGFIPHAKNQDSMSSMRSRFSSTYQPTKTLNKHTASSEEFIGHNIGGGLGVSKQNRQHQSLFSEQLDLPAEPTTGQKKQRRFGRSRRSSAVKHKRSGFKKFVRGFSVLVVATLIGVSSLFAYGYIKSRNIFKGNGEGAAALQKDVDPARLNGEGDGRVNILLLGKGGPGHEAPDLTDTLLVASIDPLQNEAALVSVPRDMYVKNADGYSMKINAVYATAKNARLANGDESAQDKQAAEDSGLTAVKQAVGEVLGIPIHYYVMVDFEAFKQAIDTVGGITVEVKEPLYDQSVAWLLGGNPLVADEGLQTMDGNRALLYARSRMGSARGDFDRTERQREIIVALQKKVLSLGTFSNPFKVVELMGNFGDRVRTDLNGLEEIKRLYEIGQAIGPDKITSVGLADPPNVLVRTDMIGNQSVVVPSEGLYQYAAIHSYIRNTIRDPFLKQENARVIILNGTETAGLATATSEELKSYGYNVIDVDNAPTTDYVQNQLIDLTGGTMRYTKSYLERRLGLQTTTSDAIGLPTLETADFVIILGTDEVLKTLN
jgi:LCP family protein required for cell wall assembly